MRAGDLVRFKYTGAFAEEWKIGLVREYDSLYKVVVVIFEGKEKRIAASLTELHKRAKRD